MFGDMALISYVYDLIYSAVACVAIFFLSFFPTARNDFLIFGLATLCFFF